MDFKKKLIILGSILGGLVVLFVIGVIASSIGQGSQEAKVFPDLKTDVIGRVLIEDKTARLEFSKAEGSWWLVANKTKFIAAKERLESLMKSFAELRKSKIASTNKETWSSFNVDEKNAFHVVLSDANGAPAADCYFGKAGATSYSQYIRVAGKEEVIQANLHVENSTSLKDWVERRLFTDEFAIDDIERVSLKSNMIFIDSAKGTEAVYHPVSLVFVQSAQKKDNTIVWKLSGNEDYPLSPVKVNQLVASFLRFNAENIVIPPEDLKVNRSSPLGSIEVRLKNGTMYTLYLLDSLPSDPNSYYITNQDKKYIYVSSNISLKDIFKGLETLVDAGALLK
jgi:hypothetical protein